MRLNLPNGEAHIWLVDPAAFVDEELHARALSVMSPDEARRHSEYRFERNRLEYLTTRALVRCTLARYGSDAPDALRFVVNRYGRPEIEASSADACIGFNLSNTSGLVVGIFARDRDVGVDAEDIERRTASLELADRFFSRAEAAALRRVATADQPARFFDHWTLKEAYIKARGMGLALPLDAFGFDIDARGAISIAIDESLGDDAASWQFAQFRPTSHHRISAAVRKCGSTGVRFVVRWWRPSLDDFDAQS